MTQRTPKRSRTTTFAKRVVLFLTATVSSLALAQAVPTIGGGGDAASKVPYRGTSVSYGATTTVYNYTPETVAISHRLGLMPEWHFHEKFWVRSRFFLTQEFTDSDSTTYKHEVELSDLWLDAVWGGWREQVTGIRIAGDLRTTFPTSKFSQSLSRIMTLAPGANVSKTFKVLAGLTFIYSGRFTYRFNRFTTRQNVGGQIVDRGTCASATQLQGGLVDACTNTNTGATNVLFDVIHGPTVSFSPHARLNVSASLFMQRGWVAPSMGVELPNGLSIAPTPWQTRDFIGFSLGVTFQPWDVVGFTLGAFTFANQLDSEGKTIFPLFNRNTVASLDATFDLEAAVSSFTKEKK